MLERAARLSPAARCSNLDPLRETTMAMQRTGRQIGVLILLQMIGSGVTNFVLLAFPAPGFLPNAAPHAPQVGAAVLLGLATGAISAGIAIAASTAFRQYSRIAALW